MAGLSKLANYHEKQHKLYTSMGKPSSQGKLKAELKSKFSAKEASLDSIELMEDVGTIRFHHHDKNGPITTDLSVRSPEHAMSVMSKLAKSLPKNHPVEAKAHGLAAGLAHVTGSKYNAPEHIQNHPDFKAGMRAAIQQHASNSKVPNPHVTLPTQKYLAVAAHQPVQRFHAVSIAPGIHKLPATAPTGAKSSLLRRYRATVGAIANAPTGKYPSVMAAPPGIHKLPAAAATSPKSLPMQRHLAAAAKALPMQKHPAAAAHTVATAPTGKHSAITAKLPAVHKGLRMKGLRLGVKPRRGLWKRLGKVFSATRLGKILNAGLEAQHTLQETSTPYPEHANRLTAVAMRTKNPMDYWKAYHAHMNVHVNTKDDTLKQRHGKMAAFCRTQAQKSTSSPEFGQQVMRELNHAKIAI